LKSKVAEDKEAPSWSRKMSDWWMLYGREIRHEKPPPTRTRSMS